MKQFCLLLLLFVSARYLPAQDIDPRTVSYVKVDSIILSLKPDRFSSEQQLADFINATFKTEHEKLRAVFRWVTNNIRYAYHSDTEAKEVFKSKQAICQGYSDLTNYLCLLTNVQCDIVTGIARNDVYDLDKSACISNHAWNMITLYNKKYLLDATWGAGYVKSEDSTVFVKEFDEAYFLTPPEIFILNHFPDKQEDQLLMMKKFKTDYCNSPVFHTQAIVDGITSYAPAYSAIRSQNMSRTNFSFDVRKKIKRLEIQLRKFPNDWEAEMIPIDFVQTGNKVTFYWEYEMPGSFYLIIYFDHEEAIMYTVDVK